MVKLPLDQGRMSSLVEQLALIALQPPHHRKPPPQCGARTESLFANDSNGLLQQNRPISDLSEHCEIGLFMVGKRTPLDTTRSAHSSNWAQIPTALPIRACGC